METTKSIPISVSDSPVVEMINIWKLFPGIIANQAVNMELISGEIHALLGENGAGKSTLMRVLSGQYKPDKGTINLHGNTVELNSPASAISAGIGMVHQHFRLVDKLTVAENIHLGWDKTPKYLTKSLLTARTEQICRKYGLDVDPSAKVWQLSVGEQQRVEILRVLSRGARVLIFDEPTAVLTPQETDELFKITRKLVDEGRTLVLISHKLNEVLEISDRISVLRQGKKVETCITSKCDTQILANMMVGKEVTFEPSKKVACGTRFVLEMKNATAMNDKGLRALHRIKLKIKENEIVGVAGVSGNGQTELAEVLTGLRQLKRGKIVIDGSEITNKPASAFAEKGIGHIPEDRRNTGLVLNDSVARNAIMREYGTPPIKIGYRLNKKRIFEVAGEIVTDANVNVPSLNTDVRFLSGGNQQRLVLQREFRIGKRIVIAVHPTRGLDVAATDVVRKKLVDHRNRGCGILLISEDLDELLLLSDRILVMFENRFVGEFNAADANREKLGLLMGGHNFTQ